MFAGTGALVLINRTGMLFLLGTIVYPVSAFGSTKKLSSSD